MNRTITKWTATPTGDSKQSVDPIESVQNSGECFCGFRLDCQIGCGPVANPAGRLDLPYEPLTLLCSLGDNKYRRSFTGEEHHTGSGNP
jgi:hypothetical protein